MACIMYLYACLVPRFLDAFIRILYVRFFNQGNMFHALIGMELPRRVGLLGFSDLFEPGTNSSQKLSGVRHIQC